MLLKKKDLKNGVLTLQLQAPDDLWHLSHILEKGDLVRAKTVRTATIKTGSEFKKGDKVPMVLTVKLERMEFSEGSGELRLAGTIEEGPEEVQRHSFHTLSVGPHSQLKVTKAAWSPYALDRITRSQIKQPLLLVVAIDREDATVALLRESGIEWKAKVAFQGKSDRKKEADRQGYYREIAGVLALQPEVKAVVIAGPGFEKEHLLAFLKAEQPGLAEKAVLETASDAGRAGVTEVIEESSQRILKETRIAKEAGYLKIFFTELRKDGLVVYGPKETREALEYGAVDQVLVSEQKIKEYDPLLQLAEKTGAAIRFISADHEQGEQFLNLGGVGGILRYRYR